MSRSIKWESAALSEIALVQAGGTPSRSNSEYWENGSIPWVKIGDIQDNKVNKTSECITKNGLDNSAAKVFPKGTLLYTIFATLGEVSILEIDAATNQAIAGITPKNDLVDSEFLFHYLRSIKEKVVDSGRGVAQNNINLGMLREIVVPLPPLPEQKRIAAILDSADAIRQKRKAAIAKLDVLAQSVFLEMFGDPVKNEKGWKTLPLTEACDLYSGGTPTTSDESLWGNDLPWFSPKDMKASYLTDSIDHISQKCVSSGKLKLLPERTIAIVVRGMILAHTFPVCCITKRATINQDMKALLPRESIESDFLLFCLKAQAKHALSLVSVAAHGTTRLDTNALANIPILLPPIKSQEAFVERIQTLQAIRDYTIVASEKEQNLFSSLQHRAFAGEL